MIQNNVVRVISIIIQPDWLMEESVSNILKFLLLSMRRGGIIIHEIIIREVINEWELMRDKRIRGIIFWIVIKIKRVIQGK